MWVWVVVIVVVIGAVVVVAVGRDDAMAEVYDDRPDVDCPDRPPADRRRPERRRFSTGGARLPDGRGRRLHRPGPGRPAGPRAPRARRLPTELAPTAPVDAGGAEPADRPRPIRTRTPHVSDVVVGRGRPAALPLGPVDAGLRRLPRRRVGPADPRRQRPVRAADPRGVPVRTVVADDPAQAGELPGGVRRLRHRQRSREFDAADRERLLADAGIVRNRAKVDATMRNAKAAAALDEGLAEVIWAFAPTESPSAGGAGRRTRADGRVEGTCQGAQTPRFRVRRPDDGLRADAGGRPGQRPPARLLGSHRSRVVVGRHPMNASRYAPAPGRSSSWPRSRSRSTADRDSRRSVGAPCRRGDAAVAAAGSAAHGERDAGTAGRAVESGHRPLGARVARSAPSSSATATPTSPPCSSAASTATRRPGEIVLNALRDGRPIEGVHLWVVPTRQPRRRGPRHPAERPRRRPQPQLAAQVEAGHRLLQLRPPARIGARDPQPEALPQPSRPRLRRQHPHAAVRPGRDAAPRTGRSPGGCPTS